MLKKILVLGFIAVFVAWFYQGIRPPPPKKLGSIDGPPVTSSRIQLRDGRYLAYEEFGVPKNIANHKIVFVHACTHCRHDVSFLTAYLSPDIVESKGIYVVSFDRPGYGESDPHPTQTHKSIAFDIEELADQLELGSKFFIIGYSIGGLSIWNCLKYIPHRLAGAALIAPAVNFWWKGFPLKISEEAFSRQLLQDQWSYRVAYHLPWLYYWWNTQTIFPAFSVTKGSLKIFSRQDMELLLPRFLSLRTEYQAQVTQQGEFESVHRDIMIGFGKWEFDPTDLKNITLENGVAIHLWQGEEDHLVPVTLQQYIVKQLPWIKYHELPGAGHLLPYGEGFADSMILELLVERKSLA